MESANQPITPETTPNPQVPAPPQNHKWVMWTLPVIVILTIISAATYYFSNQTPKPTPPPSPAEVSTKKDSPTTMPDEIASWKTYRDERLRFSLNYPSDWIVNPIQSVIVGGTVQILEDPKGEHTFTITTDVNYNKDTGNPFTSIHEYTNLLYTKLNKPYAFRTVLVDGQEGVQPLPPAVVENASLIALFSKDSKNIYGLSFITHISNVVKIQEGQRIFNQILSTFRFIDQ